MWRVCMYTVQVSTLGSLPFARRVTTSFQGRTPYAANSSRTSASVSHSGMLPTNACAPAMAPKRSARGRLAAEGGEEGTDAAGGGRHTHTHGRITIAYGVICVQALEMHGHKCDHKGVNTEVASAVIAKVCDKKVKTNM